MRKYDLVVLGDTGYTGKLVAHYFTAQISKAALQIRESQPLEFGVVTPSQALGVDHISCLQCADIQFRISGA